MFMYATTCGDFARVTIICRCVVYLTPVNLRYQSFFIHTKVINK